MDSIWKEEGRIELCPLGEQYLENMDTESFTNHLEEHEATFADVRSALLKMRNIIGTLENEHDNRWGWQKGSTKEHIAKMLTLLHEAEVDIQRLDRDDLEDLMEEADSYAWECINK